MDRREFLKATFAASAATVALAEVGLTPLEARIEARAMGEGAPLPQMVAQQAERVRMAGNGTTDLGIIAQHILRQIASRLEVQAFPTILTEGVPMSHQSPAASVGWNVMAYAPGMEGFEGPQQVTLTDQVSALWVVPSRLSGSRREVYVLVEDAFKNVPDVDPEPVDLKRLDPIVDQLTTQILTRRINVFSPDLYMPIMGGGSEGAVGFASRTYGLAIRVVRCLGPDHELVMRADLLGGTFPTEPVNRG